VGLGVNPVKIAAIAVEVVLVDVGWAVEAMSYTENGSAAPEQKGTDVDFVAAKSVAVAVVVADVAEEEEPVVVVAAAAAAAAAAAMNGMLDLLVGAAVAVVAVAVAAAAAKNGVHVVARNPGDCTKTCGHLASSSGSHSCVRGRIVSAMTVEALRGDCCVLHSEEMVVVVQCESVEVVVGSAHSTEGHSSMIRNSQERHWSVRDFHNSYDFHGAYSFRSGLWQARAHMSDVADVVDGHAIFGGAAVAVTVAAAAPVRSVVAAENNLASTHCCHTLGHNSCCIRST